MTDSAPVPVSTPAGPHPSLLKRCLFALIAGAIGPLAFSPNNMWLLGIISVMGLYMALKHATPRQGGFTGWFFGVGFFGTGASWVFVSINVYGNAGPELACFLTGLFVAGLALFFALQCWINQRFFNCSFYIFSFAALWVLGEWLRSWFLTGFPWLYMGYPHTDSTFSGVAPVFGVMGISLIVVITGASFGEMFLVWLRTHSGYTVAKTYLPTGLFFMWIATSLLGNITWVTPVADSTLEVGLVQANIDQKRKFDRSFIEENLDRYESLSNPLWDTDIVIWPETAIPYIYDRAGHVRDYFSGQAQNSGTALITGIFGETDAGLHNSITSLGIGSGIYHKQKLVPFGEYVPLRFLLSGLLELFALPMSSLEEGPANQDMLRAHDYTIAPFICYEVVYPDFVRRQAVDADLLVTISNDTWFGASWGPLQHLEMAAMRALENGRYMIRATNNGVSAIINEKGQITARSGQFTAEVLRGELQVMTGRTPFSYWGTWPILLICTGLLILAIKSPSKLLINIYRLRSR